MLRPTTRDPYPYRLWLLLGIGLFFRIWRLSEGLWYDEVIYATSYGDKSFADIWRFVIEQPPAPIFTLLMFAWRQLSEREWFLRLPALIAGMAAIPLCYKLARTCCNRWTATVATLMLCVSPAHIWYSQDASPHTIAVACCLLTVYAFSRRRIFPVSKAWWSVYTLALFACIFTHYLYVLVLAPLSLLALFERRRVLLRVVLSHALVFGLFVAMLLLKLSQENLTTGMRHLRPFGPFEMWMQLLSWNAYGNTFSGLYPYATGVSSLWQLPGELALQVAVLVVFLRGCLQFVRRPRKRRGREVFACLLGFPFVLGIFSVCGMRNLYIERYLLQTLPLFLIFLALGVGFPKQRALHLAGSMLLLSFGLASVVALAVHTERWTVFEPKSDWRGVVEHMRAHPGGFVAQLGRIELTPLRYYKKLRPVPRPDENTPSAWIHVIKSPIWKDPLIGGIGPSAYKLRRQVMESGAYRLAGTYTFGGTKIWTYRRLE